MKEWYVMRDLKRSNAKLPAYKMLMEKGFEVFTPMVWKVVSRRGKRLRIQVPYMQDLLFVFDTRRELDPIVELVPTLQYRFVRGMYCEPMTVRCEDMERFITAVKSAESPCFYTPGEVTPDMIGHKVRIVGGPLDSYEGRLQKIRGSRSRRLFVELPALLTVSVEVNPEDIVEKVGGLQEPETEKGVREVYVGEKAEDGSETFSFKQNFKKVEGTTFEKVKIKVKVIYQTCSSQTCLPPVEGEHTVEVIF